MSTDHTILRSDLGACLPAGALSERWTHRHWQKVSYEAEGVAGTLLMAGPETEAPPVTLPLGVRGWYAIHLGVFSDQWGGPDCLRVKLTDDPCFVPIVRAEPGFDSTILIDEIFWKYADLTGQDITFAQLQPAGRGRQASIAFVKLIPLSADEVAAIQAERGRCDTRRLIAMDDNFSFYCERQIRGVEDLWEEIEPYRHSDVGRLFWCTGAGGDVTSYPTRVGRLVGRPDEHFPGPEYRNVVENVRFMRDHGIDPMRVARDYAHELGIEFHISVRLGAFQIYPFYEQYFSSDFYLQHPEWHCVDRDGRPIARLSYAYPQVQDHIMALLDELAGYSPDGLNLIFTRCAPYVLYEPPLVDGYRRLTGKDPRELDERDADYLRYRAGIMTDFVRRVRAFCDGRRDSSGRPLRLSANVLNDADANAFYGLDVATWAREGILNIMIPDSWVGRPIDFDYFAGVARGTTCELSAEIMPRRMPADEYRRRAAAAYAAGAQGLCLWDASGRHQVLSLWNTVRRLGHHDDLAAGAGPDEYFRAIPVKSLAGYTVDKYPPYWTF